MYSEAAGPVVAEALFCGLADCGTARIAAAIKMDASQMVINSGQVLINSGMVKCSGIVQCDTLIANTVSGTTYTPGAGNIW